MEWKRISDSIPDKGTRVLVYMALSKTIMMAQLEYCEEWDGNHWVGDDEFKFHSRYVKLWMPLPEAPIQKKEDSCDHEWKGIPTTEESWCAKCGIESHEVMKSEERNERL